MRRALGGDGDRFELEVGRQRVVHRIEGPASEPMRKPGPPELTIGSDRRQSPHRARVPCQGLRSSGICGILVHVRRPKRGRQGPDHREMILLER